MKTQLWVHCFWKELPQEIGPSYLPPLSATFPSLCTHKHTHACSFMQTKSPKLALARHLPTGESECPWQIKTYKMLYSRSFNLAIWEVHSLPFHAFNFKLLQSSEKPLYWIYYSLAHMLQGRGSWCFTFRLLQTWRLLSRPLHVPIIISLPLYITASVFSVSVFIRNLWSHYPHFDIQLPLTLKGLKCLNTTLSSAPKYKCCVSRRNILTELGM